MWLFAMAILFVAGSGYSVRAEIYPAAVTFGLVSILLGIEWAVLEIRRAILSKT